MDLARFAMKEFRSADDFPAERGANGLMAEANPEDRNFSSEALDQLDGNTRFLRRARAGRNHDALRLTANNFFHGNFVVAMHFDLTTQLAEILREVVGKGIVVVEQQDHDDWFLICYTDTLIHSRFILLPQSFPAHLQIRGTTPRACASSLQGLLRQALPMVACSWHL